MFQISKAVEYAILLLISLEKDKGRPLSLNKIAQEKTLPLKYLERIAGRLKKKNILQSKEGTGGGYVLLKQAEDISLFDIIEAIEGKKGLVSCIHGKCSMENLCGHKKTWQKLQKTLIREFKKITLKELT